jgi:predicted nucleic acid-binding protein
MTGRVFVDTNILIYALDPDDPQKRQVSADLLRRTISNRTLTLSPQSLNECYRVLTQRRRLMPLEQARGFIRVLAPWAIAPLDARTTERAFAVQDEMNTSWWDSLMVAAALLAECRVFISGDLQNGREVSGMRITSPFAGATDAPSVPGGPGGPTGAKRKQKPV